MRSHPRETRDVVHRPSEFRSAPFGRASRRRGRTAFMQRMGERGWKKGRRVMVAGITRIVPPSSSSSLPFEGLFQRQSLPPPTIPSTFSLPFLSLRLSLLFVLSFPFCCQGQDVDLTWWNTYGGPYTDSEPRGTRCTLERMHDAISRRGIFTSSSGEERERERNGVKHGGNGWLVMVVVVVSRYDDAPVSSELLKRHAAGKPASERGEDQRTGSRRDSRCGSLSRFLSLLPFSPASSPRNLVASRSRDRGFYAFQTAGLFAAYRVQDEAMQIVREQVARARGLVTRRPLNFIEATGPSRESELFRGRSMQRFVFGGWRSAWTLLAKTLENVSLFNSLILRCVFYAPGSRSPAWIVNFAILRF